MLMLLAIDPAQLAVISAAIDYRQWQLLSLVSLSLGGGLWIVELILVRRQIKVSRHKLSYAHVKQTNTTSEFKQQAIVSTQSSSARYQPSANNKLSRRYIFRQSGVLIASVRLIAIILFLMAVLANTLAQRMQLISIAPNQDMYIDAWVQPDGLSDKQMQVANAYSQSSLTSSNKPEVVQGYRQLVTLTDIKLVSTDALVNDSIDKSSTHTVSTNKANTSSQSKLILTQAMRSNPFNNSSSQSQASAAVNGQTINAPQTPNRSFNNVSSDHQHALNSQDYSNSNHPDPNYPDDFSSQIKLPQTMTVMLQTYQSNAIWLNDLSPNKKVRMRLKLSPLKVNNNRHEFNEYRWLSTRHAVASAKLIEADNTRIQMLDSLTFRQSINQFRYQLRQHFLSLMAKNEAGFQTTPQTSQQATAVTLSLLTGDRALIDKEMTALYRFAGISHLLAISGAHVLFLAILLARLASMFFTKYYPKVYRVMPRWQVRLVVAVAAAFVYAIFTGFDVPAMRTAWMLFIVGAVRYLLIESSVYKVLMVLAVAMAWQDVFVLWQAGFWLSFVAVALLIVYSQNWEMSQSDKEALTTAKLVGSRASQSRSIIHPTRMDRLKLVLWGFIKLQLWMSIALLPISIWLFGKVSLWGFIVNVFAIGLFGWIIVPLNLMAGVLHVLTPESIGLADIIWRFIIWLLGCFHQVMIGLKNSVGQLGWMHSDISVSSMFLMLLTLLPWLLPKGLISRYFTIPVFCILTLLALIPNKLKFQSQAHSNSTHIIEINTANANISALLIKHENSNWLLLSDYTNRKYAKIATRSTIDQSTASSSSSSSILSIVSTQKNTKPFMSPQLNEAQLMQTSQVLYDELIKHSVDALTGVIGQTVSGDIESVVTLLRRDVPISLYWQAGAQSGSAYNRDRSKLGLSVQSCDKEMYWKSLVPDRQIQHNTAHLKLNEDSRAVLFLAAVTGWSDINDPQVWDCNIQLISDLPIVLTYQPDPSKIGIASQAQTLKLAKSGETVTILASAQPKLSKLWQLMCIDTEFITNNYEYETSNVENSDNRPHWIVNKKAIVDKKLVDTVQPKTWQMIGKSPIGTSQSLHDTYLYWQLQYKVTDK